MGDRANVVMELKTGYEEDHEYGTIYLYSHWGGTDLPQTLQNALKRRVRWQDDSYLTRIIFSEMIGDLKTLHDEHGFGISLRETDNEYPFLRVNPDKQTVTVDFDPVRKYRDRPNRTYSFEDYVALPDISWETLGR